LANDVLEADLVVRPVIDAGDTTLNRQLDSDMEVVREVVDDVEVARVVTADLQL